jgi:uncharacterized membrane protein YphA (DoxX/SURF4 family)
MIIQQGVVTMNIVLWIIQALLAFAFLGAGSLKLIKNRDALLTDKRMAWANDFSAPQIKLIGIAEVVGAIGLILPLALGVVPLLTAVAATGLALLMGGAIFTLFRRNELPAPPTILGVLSAVVAVGRFLFV